MEGTMSYSDDLRAHVEHLAAQCRAHIEALDSANVMIERLHGEVERLRARVAELEKALHEAQHPRRLFEGVVAVPTGKDGNAAAPSPTTSKARPSLLRNNRSR